MPKAPELNANNHSRRLAAIDRMLLAGIKQGAAKKRQAINRILELVPGWTRGDCCQRIRHLRNTSELAGLAEGQPNWKKIPGQRAQSEGRPACHGHGRTMTSC